MTIQQKIVLTKEKMEQLAKNKREIIQKREEEKEKREEEQIKQMTFKPNVRSLPKEYGLVKPNGDLVERLYLHFTSISYFS